MMLLRATVETDIFGFYTLQKYVGDTASLGADVTTIALAAGERVDSIRPAISWDSRLQCGCSSGEWRP